MRVVIRNVTAKVYTQISWVNLELSAFTLNLKVFEMFL